MKQEDKELLLKDLTARLPYKCKYKASKGITHWHKLTLSAVTINKIIDDYYDEIKPYLRPMVSMTEEEFESLKEYSGLKYEQLDLASYQNGTYKCLDFYLSEVPSYVVILVFDWLNSHHFDYRGLIERELAIAITEENNPYRNK